MNPSSPSAPRLEVSPLGRLAYAIAAGVIAADQLTKGLMLQTFAGHCPDAGPQLRDLLGCHIELSPVFDLTMVWNRGMSFGLFGDGGGRILLSLFAVGVAVAIGWWARNTAPIAGRPCSSMPTSAAFGRA